MKKTLLIILLTISGFAQVNIDNFKNQYERLNGEDKIKAILSFLSEMQDESEEYFLVSKDLLEVSQENNYSPGIGIALSNIGYNDYLKLKYDEALKKYDVAEELLSKSDYKIELSQLYNRYGYLYNKTNNTQLAISNISKSIQLSTKINDTTGLAYSYNNAGLIYWTTGVYDSALFNYENALYFRKALNNPLLIARTLNNLAVIYYNIGRLEVALDMYYEALEIHQRIENYYGISLVYCNIGLIQRDRREFDNAKISFNKGLEAGYLANRNDAIGYSYNSLASIYKVEEKFDSAMIYYQKSYEYYEKIEDIGGVAFNFVSIGELYLFQKDYKKSEEYFIKALEYIVPRKESLRLAQVKLRLGEIRKEQKRYQEAISYFNESINICLEINKKDFLMENYKNLSQVFEFLKLSDSALYYYKNYKETSDEIFNEGANKKILELEYRYNTALNRKQLEEKELELKEQRFYANILLLALVPIFIAAIFLIIINYNRKKANRLLKEKNDQIEMQKELLEKQAEELSINNNELKELNAVKDTFFSIIAHDLRSPFNGFIGLTSILIEDYDDLTKVEQKTFLSNLHNSATSLYKLLNNLLTWSSIQRNVINNNPQKFFINQLIEENISIMKNSVERKELLLQFSSNSDYPIFVDHDILNTILRNLISNAIKFTPRKGIIEIGTNEKSEKFIELFVKDNGIGISDEIYDSIFLPNKKINNPGTENELSTGLGLVLCKEFAEIIGGSIRFESEEGKGSTFFVTIPRYS